MKLKILSSISMSANQTDQNPRICLRNILPKNADQVIARIEFAKQNNLIPVAFFDYDGTIIDGNVAETPGGGFPGLDEILIGEGYSKCFPPGSFPEFIKQIFTMATINTSQAIAFSISIFNGAPVVSFKRTITESYEKFYSKIFFKKIADLLFCLSDLGVKIYIITGAPTIFTLDVKNYLPIDDIFGTDAKIKNGSITNQITQIPYNLLKREILEKILKCNKNFLPVIGAGNNVNTDYPFLSDLIGLGAPSYFVLDPEHTDEADFVTALGLTPIFVSEYFDINSRCFCPRTIVTSKITSCNKSTNTCKRIFTDKTYPKYQNNSCFPIIPYDIYFAGELAAQALSTASKSSLRN